MFLRELLKLTILNKLGTIIIQDEDELSDEDILLS